MAKFTLKQAVQSNHLKDSECPFGYVFAIRHGSYRVIFDDDTMRDVPEEYLEAIS